MISIDLDYTLLFQMAIFLLLMFSLQKILFKPVLTLFAERERLVSGLREEAASIEKDYLKKAGQFDELIREANLNAGAAMEKIKSEAQSSARGIIAKAHEYSMGKVDEAIITLNKEAAIVREQVKKDVETIANQMAERVLERKIS